MIDVEQLASEMFERFSKDFTGQSADWAYLSNERKQVWRRDIILIADAILIQLRKEVRPSPPSPNKINTTYSMGWEAAKKEERTNIISLLQKIHEDINKYYEQLEDK